MVFQDNKQILLKLGRFWFVELPKVLATHTYKQPASWDIPSDS